MYCELVIPGHSNRSVQLRIKSNYMSPHRQVDTCGLAIAIDERLSAQWTVVKHTIMPTLVDNIREGFTNKILWARKPFTWQTQVESC